MKKLNLFSAVVIVLVFTMELPLLAQPRGIQTSEPTDPATHSRSAISDYIVAYHDLKIEGNSYDNYEEDIANILFFIYESFDNGSLLWKGSDTPVSVRMNEMLQKVESARELLEYGYLKKGCQELSKVISGSDRLYQNSNLVYGPAIPELAKKIEFLRMEKIGCE